ncbi:hypothetical protein RBB80_31745 [Tunturiibacter gelidiferens]
MRGGVQSAEEGADDLEGGEKLIAIARCTGELCTLSLRFVLVQAIDVVVSYDSGVEEWLRREKLKQLPGFINWRSDDRYFR